MNTLERAIGLGLTSVSARSLRSLVPGVALLCALGTTGCLAQNAEDEDEAVSEAQEALETSNALTNNALTNNALTNNALTNNALTNNALTNNALTNNALTNNALTDPNAREVLKYITSCALPAGSQVNITVGGVAYSYPGEIGLAPQWGLTGGTCNTSCQEIVSSCVMARVDYLGQKVLISVRGDSSALLTTSTERLLYSSAEGTYFGNIFLAKPQRYACVAPGHLGLPRVCGPTTAGCVVENLGWCSYVCNRYNFVDGSFNHCSNQNSSSAGSPGFDRDTFDNAVTVFLGH